MTYHFERHPGISPEEVVALPILSGKPPSTHVFSPARLWGILREFQPDHIHIEEDPHSFVGVEMVSLARFACPGAKISFFIWDNLAHTPRFPINILKRMFTHYSLARAGLVVCGNLEAETLLRTVKQYAGNTAVIPQLGLDPQDYASPPPDEIRAQLSMTGAGPLIGFLGRLVPEKGLNILFEALARLQHIPWRLLLVGNGSMEAEIQARWQPLFNERLLRLEAVPHRAVPEYLKCLDIFVLPSLSTPIWKEQFGLTLAQAMLAGVACIGSSSGAISEVIGEGGVVVAEGDVNALKVAIERLIQDGEERKRIAKKGKAIAFQRFTNEYVAQTQLMEFQKLHGDPL
ncbi:MAG: glycosyltransferase family 4 protein [Chloroflexi bacterium]|nr:glycosyltransferase family 4 protein [Chloroflexota bacterium]